MQYSLRMGFRRTTCLSILSATLLLGQHSDDLSAGQKLFQKSCTACHGENAKGGRAPDLTTGQWRWGRSTAAIVQNILSGIPGTQMPASPMPEADAELVVAYLRSLKSNAPEEQPKGDPAAGRKLFFGSATCSRCHMLGGRGGRLGPDLSGIGNERKIAELQEAIVNPDKSLRRSYETAEVRLPSGQLLRGVKKNEDTFSIQIMDEKEKLHMLLKKDLKEIKTPHKSLMPATDLTGGELDNVIAFLKNPGPGEAAPPEWKPSADLNVTYSRLKNAHAEPQNWLTYWGDYEGTHYRRRSSITPSNDWWLKAQWSRQFGAGNNETMPLVVDGLMSVTG